jgi:sugar phosphate isomerase/epimerase
MLAGHIVMAHGKDRDKDGGVAAPGQGVIDFGHFLTCLRGSGFDGPVVAHGFDAGSGSRRSPAS